MIAASTFGYLEQARVLIAALVVLFAPGAAVLAVIGVPRRVPRALLPAAALAVSLALLACATVTSLALGLSIRYVAAASLLWTSSLGALWVIRSVRTHRSSLSSTLSTLLMWPTSALADRGAPLVLPALLAAVLGYVSGERFFADGDGYFHAAMSVKLRFLEHPGFTNTLHYLHGDGHPGYVVPAWHEAVALISLFGQSNVIDTMRVLPAILAPVVILVWAGLAEVSFRSPSARTITAWTTLTGIMVATLPAMDGVFNAAEPRTISSHVLLPAVWACMICASTAHMDQLTPEARSLTRRDPLRIGAIAVLCTVAMIVVHPSYVVWLFVGVAGFALSTLTTADPRLVLARTWPTVAGISIAAVALIAALYPSLRVIDESLVPTTARGVLDPLITGNGLLQHLRADWLVWWGPLALAGLACMIPLARVARDPRVMWIPMTGALVVIMSLLGPGWYLLTHTVGIWQATRISRALPWVVAIGGVGAIAASQLDRWSRRSHSELAAWMLPVAGASALGGATYTWAALLRRSDPAQIPPIVVSVVAWALVLAVAAAIVQARRPARVPTEDALPGPEPADTPQPKIRRVIAFNAEPFGTTMVCLAIIAGMAPVAWQHIDQVRALASSGPASRLELPGINAFDRISRLRAARLPRNSVVLADARLSYRLLAITPSYAVGIPPGHVAATARNHPYQRDERLRRFLDGTMSERQRLDLLVSQHVTHLMLRRDTDTSAIAFARRHPDVLHPLRSGRRQLWFQHRNR